MRNKISVIIIDPLYKYHDYYDVRTEGFENEEKSFEFRIEESSSQIFKALHEFRGVDAIITIGNFDDFPEMFKLPFDFRKKWAHIDKFSTKDIVKLILGTFEGNMNRENEIKKVSVFTCTYKTKQSDFLRLYNSLCNQTYENWNWFILDDSPNDETVKMINEVSDPRITILRNYSDHGRIGFNKHMAAMACDGDYLVEIDHDDEILPNCLEEIAKAFDENPEIDFVYTDLIELAGNVPIDYGDGWGYGEGEFSVLSDSVNGNNIRFSIPPSINSYTIRTIYTQPNHARCWRKDFYHRIGGHNTDLSVLDDMEILIRTFLYGKMARIKKILYIQHEGEGERGKSEENTQSIRFGEIQRTVWLIKERYDKEIHDRILELGFEDDAWDEESQMSLMYKPHTPGQNIMCKILE